MKSNERLKFGLSNWRIGEHHLGYMSSIELLHTNLSNCS